jgi:WD40 repeat protein
MHPFDMQCVTTGDDNMIRCWDLVSMTCTKSKKLSNVKIKIGNQNKSTRVKSRSSQRRGKRGGAATTGSFGPSNCSRAVDYDPFGEHIAVGMNDGSFMVLDEATLSKVAHKRGRGRSQWVQGTAFSPLFFIVYGSLLLKGAED